MKKPIITAFKASPDKGRGLARDMRIRWAFEELGLDYETRLVTFEEMKGPEYRAFQPFGQIPAYIEGDLVLFESGSIILHVASQQPGLLPSAPGARARAVTWMFAALNTVEPPIVERSAFWLMERDKPWFEERMPMLNERVHVRLRELATWLGSSDWLDGEFSAGDLLMVTVLRRLEGHGILEQHPVIQAYIARAEARPAYKRAFAAQLAVAQAAAAEN